MLPLLAAVTEFKTPVEEEARMRAGALAHYRHHRAALAETAVLIWRDPAGAVGKIEELVQQGVAGERIAAAINCDPAAYGALRGSDRIMERLLASGRERKDVIQAVPELVSRVRSLGASWATALETETRAVAEERRRMAVAIPGLSQAAEDALRKLVADANKQKKGKSVKRGVAAGSLEPHVAREFAEVSRALDERFGRNAILRGEKDVINCVSSAQRRAFEAMRERLQVLQQAIRAESSQEIIAERQQRAIDRARSVSR